MDPRRLRGVVAYLSCLSLLGGGAAFAASPAQAKPAPAAAAASAASASSAGGKDAKDPFKDAGLTRSGDVYVLPDEAAILDGVKALRATKAQADKETRARQVIDGQIAVKQKLIKDNEKQWHELESRLTLVTKVESHNQIVLRMNRLLADAKSAAAAIKDLDEQAAKLSTTAKNKFVDDTATLNAKADEVTEKYKSLANDAALKAAVAKANAAVGPKGSKVALGPSPAFTAAVAELKKWQSDVESEAIPLRPEHGTHSVDVLLNGERFIMEVDTGASLVSIPFEVAEKLKMKPGEQDETIQLKLADGSVIEGKEMTLKSVRVGRFTVEDVRCVVLQPGLKEAPLLLGGSFLNHFVVKLDPGARELRLTEIKGEGEKKPAPAPSGAKPAAKPSASSSGGK